MESKILTEKIITSTLKKGGISCKVLADTMATIIPSMEIRTHILKQCPKTQEELKIKKTN